MTEQRKTVVKDRQAVDLIEAGGAVLGIELGSTRIKAVLIDAAGTVLATGAHDWEAKYRDGLWTYDLADVWSGIADCYRDLTEQIQECYGVRPKRFRAIGISGMMHGYLAFDKEGEPLAAFRTWRNTNTGEAAVRLSRELDFAIPLRWSIAHLYQQMLEGAESVRRLDYMTTLAGYVHWRLTGERVLGIGDASGMFPIDSVTATYDADRLRRFEELAAEAGYKLDARAVLPQVAVAGVQAGVLTKEGAALLDPSGVLEAGIAFCPPEGDAGTGMVATNSITPKTGNISAGTSIFAMVVLEKALSRRYEQIDMVTTPAGHPVAMVHANNGTAEINAWANIFREFAEAIGHPIDTTTLYRTLFTQAAAGDMTAGDLLSYGYFAGEHITEVTDGRPLLLRRPDSRFTLANLMRVQLYSTLGAIRLGLDLLLEQEKVTVETILGHGGFFKTAGIGQQIMASATGIPVAVNETAGEGGPWGMAVLAAFMAERAEGEELISYLNSRIFQDQRPSVLAPRPEEAAGFADFMESYRAGLAVERLAGERL